MPSGHQSARSGQRARPARAYTAPEGCAGDGRPWRHCGRAAVRHPQSNVPERGPTDSYRFAHTDESPGRLLGGPSTDAEAGGRTDLGAELRKEHAGCGRRGSPCPPSRPATGPRSSTRSAGTPRTDCPRSSSGCSRPSSASTTGTSPAATSRPGPCTTCTAPRCRTSPWPSTDRRVNPRCAVYSPDFEEHGFGSPHTVVDIVTDDMPFVVDSVTTEVIRHGLGLHLTVHPVVPVRRDDGAARRHPRPARSGVGDGGRVVRPPGGRPADRRRGAGRTGPRHPPRPRRRAWPRSRTGRRCGSRRSPSPTRWTPRRRPSTRRTGTRRPPCCGGSPTTTSRSSATASTSWAPTTARTRCAPSRGRGWGCCATAGAGRSRTASRSCRPRCGRRRASRCCSTSPRRTRGRPSTSPTTWTTSASSR